MRCFWGPPGTGKSHLAQAIAKAVIDQGYRVIYWEVHILLEEIAEAALDGKPQRTHGSVGYRAPADHR